MASTQRPYVLIDSHYHLLKEEWFPEPIWDTLSSQLAGHVSGDLGNQPSAADYRAKYLSQMFDPEGEQLIRKMDELGIAKTVMLVDDWGMAVGDPPVSIEGQNRAFAQLAQRYPDRLVAFAGVDPRRPGAVELIQRCIKEWGMRGVKYHPDAGFDPNGRESYRLLEKLQEWNVPVITHTGFFFPPLKSKYAHPLKLDDVCSDFPRLRIVAAHSGRTLWWETVANMARIHPNFYGDLAGWQTLAMRDPKRFRAIMRAFLDTAGPGKVLWGTDDPVYDVMIPTRKYIEAVERLADDSSDGLRFSDAEVRGILGENARRALGI